jgi:asparagine synthase (glutamine-hydrolysing)
MEAAHEAGVKVMLDGQGADELFGGYPEYWYPWLLGLARARPTAVPGAIRSLHRRGVRPAVAMRQAALAGLQLRPSGVAPVGRASRPAAWLGPELLAAHPLERRDADVAPHGTPLARHLHRSVVSTNLPALLRYEDRNSMRFGIEARVPYLDHRLMEAAMRLPDRLRISDAITKIALRRIARGIVPEDIRTNPRKVGFETPERAWLVDAVPEIRRFLAASSGLASGVLSAAGVSDVVTAIGPDCDEAASRALWRILTIETWLRRFA